VSLVAKVSLETQNLK